MATRIETPFDSWTFADEREELVATTFNDLQKMHMQNEMVVAQSNLLTIVYDPLNPHNCGLQNAYYRGQVDILKYLLHSAEERKSELQKRLEEDAKKQQLNQ